MIMVNSVSSEIESGIKIHVKGGGVVLSVCMAIIQGPRVRSFLSALQLG